MNYFPRNVLLAASVALLCACGAKGPLFLPEEAPPIEVPVPSEAEVSPLEVEGGASPAEPVDTPDEAIDAAPEVDVEPEEEAATPPDDAG